MTAWRRKEVIGACTLYLGDCADVMPHIEKIGAVLTDPPYGINAARKRNSQKNWWKDYVGGEWDKARPSDELLRTIANLSKQSIIWGGNYFADVLPPSQRWLVWDKGQKDFSLADCELAWTSIDGAIRRITYSRSLAMRDGKQHPTQKPVEVMKWCLSFLSLKAGLAVLDPFMGSGSTGVACVHCGLPFTGIELSPDYFEIACRRIRDAHAQSDMFASSSVEPSPSTQVDMFSKGGPA